MEIIQKGKGKPKKFFHYVQDLQTFRITEYLLSELVHDDLGKIAPGKYG